jgi:hypothetical protein
MLLLKWATIKKIIIWTNARASLTIIKIKINSIVFYDMHYKL